MISQNKFLDFSKNQRQIINNSSVVLWALFDFYSVEMNTIYPDDNEIKFRNDKCEGKYIFLNNCFLYYTYALPMSNKI